MKNVLVALIVAVVIGAGLVLLQRQPAPAGTADAPSDASRAGVVNAPEAPPIDPAPYLAAFSLAPLDAPPIVGTTPAARALNAALEPYRKGDYGKAASALDGVRLNYPDDPTVALYLGISRLFMDEVPNALEILRPLAFGTPAHIAAEAAWYSLVGIARLRDPSSVEGEARALCAAGGPAAARACAAIDALEKARAAARAERQR